MLRPAILWNDQRTGAEAADLESRLGGIDGTVAATGGRMLTGFTAPETRMGAPARAGRFGDVRHVLLPKDYVRFRLCGARATDVVDASGTGWFDVAARSWSRRGARCLRARCGTLPVALESSVVSGQTPDGVAGGRRRGRPGPGAVGVGAVGAAGGPISVVLGTSGVVCAPTGEFAVAPEGRLQASCHVSEGSWFLMGVMLSAAGSLAWLAWWWVRRPAISQPPPRSGGRARRSCTSSRI